jgi:integrase
MARKSKEPLITKPDNWPQADREAWRAARRPGDVLEPGGRASHLSPASILWMERSYGYWVGWLELNGLPGRNKAAFDAVCRENVARYVVDIRQTISSSSVADHIQKLCLMTRALAPGQDWEWLRSMYRKVGRVAVPVRDKRLNFVSAEKLYGFGIELMAEAEQLSGSNRLSGAIRYRDGMMIALLAARPILRRRNLQALTIGSGLIKRGEHYWLQVVASEMKGRRLVEVSVPAELTPHLDRYITQHRPYLFPRNRNSKQPVTRDPAACSHLWVSITGTGMAAETIYQRLCLLTLAKFGKSVSPHRFRYSGATSIALEDPKYVRYSMNILGHRNFATTQRNYILAQSLEATQRHQQNVLKMRKRSADE